MILIWKPPTVIRIHFPAQAAIWDHIGNLEEVLVVRHFLQAESLALTLGSSHVTQPLVPVQDLVDDGLRHGVVLILDCRSGGDNLLPADLELDLAKKFHC